jgi:hypothetical protein
MLLIKDLHLFIFDTTVHPDQYILSHILCLYPSAKSRIISQNIANLKLEIFVVLVEKIQQLNFSHDRTSRCKFTDEAVRKTCKLYFNPLHT